MASDELLRHFIGGFVRLHILNHAEKVAICGAEMIEELKRHGYDLSPGTLYPIVSLAFPISHDLRIPRLVPRNSAKDCERCYVCRWSPTPTVSPRFTASRASWYEYGMTRSYVGIVSRRGLLALLSEEAAVSMDLLRQPVDVRQRQVAYWAVLDDAAACEVTRCIRSSQPMAAFAAFCRCAEHSGAWLPFPDGSTASP